MSNQLITISRTDQDQALPLLIPVAAEQLTVMGPVFPRPSQVTVITPPPWQPAVPVIEAPLTPENCGTSMVAWLTSLTSCHMEDFPRLPKKEILETWQKNWTHGPTWIQKHFICCNNLKNGKSAIPIACGLPRFLRRRLFKKIGFGEVKLYKGGINRSYLEEILKTHFPDHNLEHAGTKWKCLIYIFFHIKTGKIYVGSWGRDNPKGWVVRTQEHFNDALKRPVHGTPPGLCLALRTSVLSDWKIFALKRIQDSSTRSGIEGFWINALKSLKIERGFNGNTPAVELDPTASSKTRAGALYLPEVNAAVVAYRKALGLSTAVQQDIDYHLQRVVIAFQNLKTVLENELQPLP